MYCVVGHNRIAGYFLCIDEYVYVTVWCTNERERVTDAKNGVSKWIR
ncbi:hypothetical protein LRS37_11575 [Neobacillus sedimentimangrovi]|uniref:Uncharacterized protein n=1 Tax=Neobacillus sedimentimangrovi TaxID=2699460 RepID=A0ABS8QKD7_9BACI|nr:hypothetical protein [Neobacillus sedimentimangrovi]MCD4839510.1 hypothetical protein [Neobacillus sedimentimangrovi]